MVPGFTAPTYSTYPSATAAAGGIPPNYPSANGASAPEMPPPYEQASKKTQ